MSEYKKIANAQAELKVEVDKTLWKNAQEKAFDKLRANLELKGFRKGQAPKELARKSLSSQAILMEAVDLIGNEVLKDAIIEHKVELVDRPALDIETISEDALTLVFKLTVKPDVELKEYKGLGYKVEPVYVEESEVEEVIKRDQERFAELEVKEDGTVENGDTAVIDFEGFKDGVAFAGGKGENHPLEIGSGSFIPGFEEQLIGMKAGESKDINVTFPENYHSEDLKGQAVVFKVTVHEIKVKKLPELNEEFFQDMKLENVKTVDEYKAHVRENLTKQKEAEAENKAIDELLTKLVDKNHVELPEAMISEEVEQMFNEQAARMSQSGFAIEQYLQFLGKDVESFKQELRTDASKRVELRLILEAIAKAENLKASDAEVDEEYTNIANAYKMEVEKVKEYIPRVNLEYDLVLKKALDFVKSN